MPKATSPLTAGSGTVAIGDSPRPPPGEIVDPAPNTIDPEIVPVPAIVCPAGT